jgi:hypothetical protein
MAEKYTCDCGQGNIWDTDKARANHEQTNRHVAWVAEDQAPSAPAETVKQPAAPADEQYEMMQERIKELEAQVAEANGKPKDDELDWDAFFETYPRIASTVDLLASNSIAPHLRHIEVAKEIRRIMGDIFLPNEQFPMKPLDVLRKLEIPVQAPPRFYPSNADLVGVTVIGQPPRPEEREEEKP